jgi:hypothetical protein
MTKRTVKISNDQDSLLGAWEITCDTCPLLPHLNALNQPPRPCIAGISTNMQGAIPLNRCEFYQHDSVVGDGPGKAVLLCSHE